MKGVVRKERLVGLLAHSDVQPEDARPVEVRSVVELAVSLAHDGRKRKTARALQVPLRVVDEKRVAPRNLGGPVYPATRRLRQRQQTRSRHRPLLRPRPQSIRLPCLSQELDRTPLVIPDIALACAAGHDAIKP